MTFISALRFFQISGHTEEVYVFILGCMEEDLFEHWTNHLGGAEVDLLTTVALEGG